MGLLIAFHPSYIKLYDLSVGGRLDFVTIDIIQKYSIVYWVNQVQSNIVQDVHQPPIAEYEDPTAPVLLQVQRNDKTVEPTLNI